MAKRRALWASTEAPGGISTYVRVLRQSPLSEEWNIRYIVTHREGSGLTKISTFARAILSFIIQLVRARPQVIHLHAASDTSFMRKAILLWLGRLAGVPVVIHMHGSTIESYFEGLPRPLQASIVATLHQADAVVALGERRAAWLRSVAPRSTVVVVPNAVRPQRRTTQPAPGDPVNVVFLGVIGDRKGTLRLLDAWARIDHRRATLTIAGNGEVARARTRIKELGLADSVEIHEWLSADDVRALLRRSHVLVLPSRDEGQPMAVLEAMAHGLCVIASDVGGIPEMIGDGCGLLVSADDIEDIAAALKTAIYDDQLRMKCAAAGYDRVVDRFDLDKAWRRVDELYREISR